MVTYQIPGINGTFVSKDDNFYIDAMKIMASQGIDFSTLIQIIKEDGNTESYSFNNGNSSDSELTTLPDNSGYIVNPAQSKRKKKTSDVQPVPDVLEQPDLFNNPDEYVPAQPTAGSDL